MWNWLIQLHPNQISVLAAVLGSVGTVISAILALLFGLPLALRPIREQFQHKVIYEGWKDFQSKLFEFSSTISDYIGKVQSLGYFLDSQENPIVNGGNKAGYRLNKWRELMDSYQNLKHANVKFLRSFETHEVIFKPLRKMKLVFQHEIRTKLDNIFSDFYVEMFPEMYGNNSRFTSEELKQKITRHWEDMIDIGVYLDDMRVELQNETIGKVLGKKVIRREPDKGRLILTRKGFVTQHRQPKRELENAVEVT
jgi:hypothetical protein